MKGMGKMMVAAVALMLARSAVSYGDMKTPDINLAHIAQIESSNRPWVINRHEQAFGAFQIRKAVLTDYNKKHGTKYTLHHMLDLHISTEVAYWHFQFRIPQLLRYIKRPVTKETMIWVWNAGIGRVSDDVMPKITADYIAKYHKLEGR
jgi:hypothetical protein